MTLWSSTPRFLAAVPEAGHHWFFWLGAGAALLAGVGLLRWWLRRPGMMRKAVTQDLPLGEERYRRLFDNTPVQILEQDFMRIVEAFSRLRAEGVTDLVSYLTAHPGLPHDLLKLVRLADANRPAVAAAGFADKPEAIARFPQLTAAPYLEVFNYQLGAFWAGRRLLGEEFRYLDADGQERACLMQCRVNERDGQPDFSRVVLVLLDVTTAKRTSAAKMENQQLLREILARANILMWWAQVRREGGQLRWKLNVPSQSFDSRLFQLATALDRGGLWDGDHVPELAEMTAQTDQAILGGRPGYQHEFRVLSAKGATHWVSEDVGISRLGEDEWSLVGVVTEVTAQHEAEEARKATEARLHQILTQADCLLWQAHVTENAAGEFVWTHYIPPSNLYEELFGGLPPATRAMRWRELDVPQFLEMSERGRAAMRQGTAGYEQEFQVRRPEAALWLHEQVSITTIGPSQWNLIGVITNVTARHEAEEARKASEAQLQQLLSQADCMLWQAEVAENMAGVLNWTLYIPRSNLYRELFGSNPSEHPNLMWSELDVLELPEMTARSEQALRSGAPGYEQEFGARRDNRIHWLHEKVSITAVSRGQWNVVGVITDVTARREAEEARQASETQLQHILDRTDCMLWQGRVTEADGKISWRFDVPASALQRRLFGSQGLTGSPVLYDNFNVPEISEMYELGATALRRGAPGYEHEFRIVKPERTYWLHERAIIAPQGPGRWLVFGLVIDISALKEAEQVIRGSEARYRALFENIPVAILEIGLENTGRELRKLHTAGVTDLSVHLASHPAAFATLMESMFITAVNDTAVRLLKAESKEHFEKDIARLFTVEAGQLLRDFLESVWQGRNDGEMEVTLKDFAGAGHDTSLRWWMPRQDEWLRLEHAVVAVVDLTELKRAESALAAEKERLTVTLRAMSEGVITTDTQGTVLFMNRAAAELTQNDPTTAVGRPLAEICVLKRARSVAPFNLPINLVLADGALVDLPAGTTLVGRSGATCVVEGCCAPVHDADSDRIGTVLVIRDVTVRQRFEEELARGSRLESIGILAGGIAHDFNNILTAIMGNITLAQLDAEALPAVNRSLREAERATLRARDLTQQLLTFAKGGDPVRAAVLLPEIIRETTEFAMHGSRVKCEFHLPAGLWPADADKGQLSQVVQNLVINAVQAMPEGGAICISAANETVAAGTSRPLTPGEYVHISVTDTGTGIKADHLAKIFDPYFTTKQQGSGLGLSTVYSIIRKHQGHIEVVSELGRGTTFHFWLPALRENQMELPEDRAEPLTPMTGRVLFMDDEASIIAMARLLLQRLGFEVEVASDGAETVKKFAAARTAGEPFDLVVLDLTVPGGMGGSEALEQLRLIDPGVKAIVSSGYSSDPVLANYRAYGFRGMVAKPYKVDDFARVLRTVLVGSRSPFPGASRSPFPGASRPPEKTA